MFKVILGHVLRQEVKTLSKVVFEGHRREYERAQQAKKRLFEYQKEEEAAVAAKVLERWLNGQEHWPLLQKIQVPFPALASGVSQPPTTPAPGDLTCPRPLLAPACIWYHACI